MCELLVGLPDVTVLAVDDRPDSPIVVHIESRPDQSWCRTCGVRARIKERSNVELVDLPFERFAPDCLCSLACPGRGLDVTLASLTT